MPCLAGPAYGPIYTISRVHGMNIHVSGFTAEFNWKSQVWDIRTGLDSPFQSWNCGVTNKPMLDSLLLLYMVLLLQIMVCSLCPALIMNRRYIAKKPGNIGLEMGSEAKDPLSGARRPAASALPIKCHCSKSTAHCSACCVKNERKTPNLSPSMHIASSYPSRRTSQKWYFQKMPPSRTPVFP